MTNIDYAILILFIIVVLIKFYEGSVEEGYTTLMTPFSKANQNIFNSQSTAVNIKPIRNYGNFGIIGKFPAIPICNSCQLEFDCSNYDYDNVDDKNTNVCRKCGSNVLGKNYNQLDKPLYVFARSAGRPRQCRQIN